ncbi:MAG: efflux RND transporter periplasmic adaptor subunit [Desulfobacteraceae bacterium]|nr:efflux RND transporter periplasmic adaptor subunit [Desulfobacteraceae bacterium]
MSPESLDNLTISKSVRSKSVKRTGRLKVIIISLVILAVIAGVYLLRSGAVTIETTTVSQIYPTQSFTLLNASGYVVAQRKAAVASKTTGRLEWIGVEEGSLVKSGQLIARLENKDLKALVLQGEAGVQSAQASLGQVRADLADAEQSYKRQKKLLQLGIVSQADFDSAEARFKRSLAAVKAAEAGVRGSNASLQGATVNLEYSQIRAPFDAVVLTKNADVGDIITPLGAAANAKAAVVTIADLSSLQVEADVSESNLSQVKKGQPCEIMLDALPGSRFRGVVHTVVPTADRSKASVMVKIRFIDTDSRILPEMSAKVAFLEHEAGKADQQPRIAVNPAAIVKMKAGEGVYLIKDDHVLFVPVTVGARLGDMVEVSGVKSGDKLALKPLDKLKDGARIALPEKM